MMVDMGIWTYKSLKREIADISRKIESLQVKKRQLQAQLDKELEAVKKDMLANGVVQDEDWTLIKARPKVVVTGDVPIEYSRMKQEPDKTALYKALSKGIEIENAKLEENYYVKPNNVS